MLEKKHTSLEDFVSNGKVGVLGVFFSFSLHLMQNSSPEPGNTNKAKYKRSELPLWNPGQTFLKEIGLFKVNRVLPNPIVIVVCLPSFLFAVCLLVIACLAFYVSTGWS